MIQHPELNRLVYERLQIVQSQTESIDLTRIRLVIPMLTQITPPRQIVFAVPSAPC